MAASIRFRVARVCAYILARFPFVNAITLVLLLAERAKRETYPPIHPNIIYANIGLAIALGCCMSFNMKRKEAAMIHACQLFYLAYAFYTNDKLKYREWLRIRMTTRTVGAASIFLFFSYFVSAKPRSFQLRRLAETLLGIYQIALAYIYVQSKEDRQAFLQHLPGGQVTLYLYIVLLATCACCFLAGYFVYDVSQCLIFLLIISTSFIDCDVKYWNKKRGVEYWNQWRMIIDHACIIFGMFLLQLVDKRRVPKED